METRPMAGTKDLSPGIPHNGVAVSFDDEISP